MSNETKQEKRIRKALRSYRGRFFKNFLIWLWGVVSFVILFVAGIVIALGVIPTKSLLGNNTDKAGVVADKTLLEVMMNIGNYTFEDIPYVKDLVVGLNDTKINEDTKLSDYVLINTDNIDKKSIVGFFSEIDKNIEIVATIDNTVGLDALGDLGKLEIFSKWEEVEGTIDTNADTFNSSLYYYKNSNNKYVKAFSADKQRLAPTGATIYYGALGHVPVTDAINIIDESLGRQKLTDLISGLGGATLTDDSLVTKILGDKTVSQIGEITDVDLDALFPESQNQQLFNVLRSAAGLGATEKVTLNSLNGMDITRVKLSVVVPIEEDNEDFYDILEAATNLDREQITIESLVELNVDDIDLQVIVKENQNNAKLYDILRSLTKTPTGPISVGQLANININTLDLSVVIENQPEVFDILRSATGIGEGEPITVADLSTFSVQNIKLNKVLTLEEETVLYKLLVETLGDYNEIKVSDLSSLDFNDVKLSTIIETPNSDLKNLLVELYNVDSYDDITIKTLNGAMSLGNIKLSSVIKENTENAILEAVREDSSVTIANIGNKINTLSLYTLYGQDVFTTSSANTNNPYAKYEQTTVSGKVRYTLSSSGTYYINKNAGVWLLLCFNNGTTNADGNALFYEEGTSTLSTLESGSGLTDTIKYATIRQLIDIGLISSNVKEEFHGEKLFDVFEGIA